MLALSECEERLVFGLSGYDEPLVFAKNGYVWTPSVRTKRIWRRLVFALSECEERLVLPLSEYDERLVFAQSEFEERLVFPWPGYDEHFDHNAGLSEPGYCLYINGSNCFQNWVFSVTQQCATGYNHLSCRSNYRIYDHRPMGKLILNPSLWQPLWMWLRVLAKFMAARKFTNP